MEQFEENFDHILVLLKETMRNLTDDIPIAYYGIIISLLVLFIVANVRFLIEKNYVGCASGFGILLAFIASGIDMFPISERLWNWIYPIYFIDIVYALEWIIRKQEKRKWITWILGLGMILMICLNAGVIDYSKVENAYRDKYEINPLIDYVSANIQEDESCYVAEYSIPTVRYKLGYGDAIGQGTAPNIIWSAGNVKDEEIAQIDCKAIIAAKKCYILGGGLSSSRWEIIQEQIEDYGNIELVAKVFGTKLWKYEGY